MGLVDYSYYLASTISDGSDRSDNFGIGFANVVIGTFMAIVSISVLVFIGLFLWRNIGPIVVFGIIGLSFWACAHYGNQGSLVGRIRYRTGKRRAIIERRLSE